MVLGAAIGVGMGKPTVFDICGLGQKIYAQPPIRRSNEGSVYAQLTGKFKLYSYEWDSMVIDETRPELEAFQCFTR